MLTAHITHRDAAFSFLQDPNNLLFTKSLLQRVLLNNQRNPNISSGSIIKGRSNHNSIVVHSPLCATRSSLEAAGNLRAGPCASGLIFERSLVTDLHDDVSIESKWLHSLRYEEGTGISPCE